MTEHQNDPTSSRGGGTDCERRSAGSVTLDTAAMDAARQRWATRAKPPGALSDLEDLGVQLAGVTGRCPPPIPGRPAVALFAGDHGVVRSGASAWPQEITAAMVATIAAGGAAINAFATVVGAEVTVVDVGVATPLPTGPPSAAVGSAPTDGAPPATTVLDRRVRPGTGDLSVEPAMSTDEATTAVEVGRSVAADLIDGGVDCLVGGEMGIGNTTPSAALIAACTGLPPTELTGPGAGTPVDGLDHKQRLIETGLARAGAAVDRPLDLLAELGGLEIAALVGLQMETAERRIPFVVDGVIALAALCVADRLTPGTASLAIAGHRSAEPAATAALDHLGLRPLLDLRLRLGEGTGATLAIPLIQAAATALSNMADLPAG
ncbi:MAG: nicotinate-nucleotide--dimethylbenzimidazole phosphoribosyltransferase [Actinomycetota bacterium]